MEYSKKVMGRVMVFLYILNTMERRFILIRKKESLFKVREKTIGLIKEDLNYNKIDNSTINQIVS